MSVFLESISSSLLQRTRLRVPYADQELYNKAKKVLERMLAGALYRKTHAACHAQEAEEIAHSALKKWIMSCLQNEEWEYRSSGAAKAYLRDIIESRLMDYFRRCSRMRHIQSDDFVGHIDPKADTPCETLIEQEQREWVMTSSDVPPRVRQLFKMLLVDQHIDSVKRVAARTGQNSNTLRRSLRDWIARCKAEKDSAPGE